MAGVECSEISFQQVWNSHHLKAVLSGSFNTISRAICPVHRISSRWVVLDYILRPCYLTVGILSLDHKELISLLVVNLLVHFVY